MMKNQVELKFSGKLFYKPPQRNLELLIRRSFFCTFAVAKKMSYECHCFQRPKGV